MSFVMTDIKKSRVAIHSSLLHIYSGKFTT